MDTSMSQFHDCLSCQRLASKLGGTVFALAAVRRERDELRRILAAADLPRDTEAPRGYALMHRATWAAMLEQAAHDARIPT